MAPIMNIVKAGSSKPQLYHSTHSTRSTKNTSSGTITPCQHIKDSNVA